MDAVTTPQQILDVARSQLGTAEAPNGSNKYGIAYGMDRVAWCAEFVWWCFREAGASDLIHPKTAYTPTLAGWFSERGRFDGRPQPGDLVFYNWPDSVPRIQHVGIVETVEPAAIIAIEGNTSVANQSDGGRVMRRRRARNASIVGYGHPAYTAAPTVITPTPTPIPTVSKETSVLRSIQVSGKGTHREGLPVGKASAVYARAWVSLLADGGEGATATVYFQNDVGGLQDRPLKCVFRAGWSSRDWVQAPDGTTQVNVVYDAPHGAVLVLEAEPK